MRRTSGGALSHPICMLNSSGAMRSPREEVSSAFPPSLSTMKCSLATIGSISCGSASRPIPKTSPHDQKSSAGDRGWSWNRFCCRPALSKATQRVLAESIARELGPKGIHVAYIIIDAVIDLEWTRKMRPDAPDDFFIQPRDIAAEVWHVAHQTRTA